MYFVSLNIITELYSCRNFKCLVFKTDYATDATENMFFRKKMDSMIFKQKYFLVLASRVNAGQRLAGSIILPPVTQLSLINTKQTYSLSLSPSFDIIIIGR